jgi:hypothetical protein
MRFCLSRSRAFWFGLPGSVFLLWAWADSMTTATHAAIMWKKSSISDSVTHHGGSLDIAHWAGSFGVSLWPKEFRVQRQPRGDAKDWFPVPGIREHGILSGSLHLTSRVVIPHWCLVSLYLISWSGLMGWRWWTYRRASHAAQVA